MTKYSGIDMKVGILGGTFDPIHNGHLSLGIHAYKQFDLDEIWVLPSGNPGYKKNPVTASPKDRCRMAELAIRDYPYMKMKDLECHRSGYIYTSDTLLQLHEEFPKDQFYFIVGADSVFQMETWHEPAVLFSLCTILAAIRDDYDETALCSQMKYLHEKYHAQMELLKIPKYDISSTELRQKLLNHMDVKNDIPEQVLRYIREKRLYERE